MTRAAIYARYSSEELQTDDSVARQLHDARALAQKLGATQIREFIDAGISGEIMVNRPQVNALMAAVEAGEIDLVIAEHTDRLSRGPTDSWSIFEDLRDLGVRYVTVQQGEVTVELQSMATALSAMSMAQLRRRIRGGQEQSIRAGRYQGPIPYGYRDPRQYDAKGERIPGLREIDPAQAPIVVRIFEEYASGLSPLKIVAGLNAEGIPGPSGGDWTSMGVHGTTKVGDGILRNELYRGQVVWGRGKWKKNRRTGERKRTKNAADVATRPAPELRIVSDDLWAAVQAELLRRARGPDPRADGRRPARLLSGLITCGCCGGPMVITGGHQSMVCRDRVVRGQPCDNGRRPDYPALEARVLASVQANLLHPDVVADSAREYQRAIAEAEKAAPDHRAVLTRELAEIEAAKANLVREVEKGMPWSIVSVRHGELDARATTLQATIAGLTRTAEVFTLRPAASELFRQMVEELQTFLTAGERRLTSGPRQALRDLIEMITVHPIEGRGRYELAITANLSPLLQPLRQQYLG